MRYYLSAIVILVIVGIGCSEKSKQDEVPLTEAERTEYLEKGGEFAGATQKVLGSNLVRAIEEGGPLNALEFCNIQAYPLTDSMAVELSAHIKRVTDKPRNPENAANKNELKYIRTAQEVIASGGEVKPEIGLNNGKITAYYPIITNQLCMQCHGSEGDQISEETLAKITELYPNDQATGYKVGELRGIWVVEMENEQVKE